MLGFATAPLPRTSLVFKPQYLELATAVDPDATIYGLGEQELLRWSTPYKLHCNICMCCTVQSPRWCHTFFFPGSSLQYTAARRLLAYCHAILWPHQPPPGERVQRSGDLRLPRDGRRVRPAPHAPSADKEMIYTALRNCAVETQRIGRVEPESS